MKNALTEAVQKQHRRFPYCELTLTGQESIRRLRSWRAWTACRHSCGKPQGRFPEYGVLFCASKERMGITGWTLSCTASSGTPRRSRSYAVIPTVLSPDHLRHRSLEIAHW